MREAEGVVVVVVVVVVVGDIGGDVVKDTGSEVVCGAFSAKYCTSEASIKEEERGERGERRALAKYHLSKITRRATSIPAADRATRTLLQVAIRLLFRSYWRV